ncbi:hypothetical protein BGZ83_008071 [Gryganskiella cystojenkinii]|nr:hypothetical protein BGZ83_008071 [Gryganskiella cystojenkinii]
MKSRRHWHPNGMHSHPRQDPLTLPEIVERVGFFLNNSSLKKSLLVCRDWYQTLLPLAWTSVYIDYSQPIAYTTFRTHAHFIQELIIRDADYSRFSHCNYSAGDYFIYCPKLSTLEIRQGVSPSSFEETDEDDAIVDLIGRHKETLRDVRIHRTTTPLFLDALSLCPNLEFLQISRLLLENPEAWKVQYESLWSRLTHLHLGGEWFSDFLIRPNAVNDDDVDGWQLLASSWNKNIQPQETKTTTIKELEIEARNSEWFTIQIQRWLILQSPGLKRLRWKTRKDDMRDACEPPMKLMAKTALHHRANRSVTSELLSLALPDNHFKNQDFQVVLQSLNQLEALDLSGSNFDQGSLAVLKDVFAPVPSWSVLLPPSSFSMARTLKVLNVRRCARLTGALTHELLCTIPGLEEFEGNYINDVNLRDDPRPWLCSERLRKLCLTFVGGGIKPPLLQQSQQQQQETINTKKKGPNGRLQGWLRRISPALSSLSRSGPVQGQTLFLNRLSRLSRLEILDLSPHFLRDNLYDHKGVRDSTAIYQDGFQVELLKESSATPGTLRSQNHSNPVSSSLDGLRDLQRLKTFVGTNAASWRWGREEAEWALRHWPQLETLSQIHLDDEAAKLLKGRGINFRYEYR